MGFTGVKRWRNATVTSGGPDDLPQEQDRAAEPIADREEEGPVHDQCGGQRALTDHHSSCCGRFGAFFVDVHVALISTAIASGFSSSRRVENRALVAFETRLLMVVRVDGAANGSDSMRAPKASVSSCTRRRGVHARSDDRHGAAEWSAERRASGGGARSCAKAPRARPRWLRLTDNRRSHPLARRDSHTATVLRWSQARTGSAAEPGPGFFQT